MPAAKAHRTRVVTTRTPEPVIVTSVGTKKVSAYRLGELWAAHRNNYFM